MPTRHTAGVEDGTITGLRDYALQCARGFGALAHMRDDDWDAPIPDVIKPYAYHKNALKKAQARLKQLERMKTDEIAECAKNAHTERRRRELDALAEVRAQNNRHRAMLLKVRDWEPPTKDHASLKEMMIDDLKLSIRDEKWYVEDVSDAQTPAEWYAAEIEIAEHDIAYHEKRWRGDQDRAEKETTWLRQLLESLS